MDLVSYFPNAFVFFVFFVVKNKRALLIRNDSIFHTQNNLADFTET